jgi:hypothetical protein
MLFKKLLSDLINTKKNNYNTSNKYPWTVALDLSHTRESFGGIFKKIGCYTPCQEIPI